MPDGLLWMCVHVWVFFCGLSYCPAPPCSKTSAWCIHACALQTAQVLERLSYVTLFAFTGIMYREIVKDCTDIDGEQTHS